MITSFNWTAKRADESRVRRHYPVSCFEASLLSSSRSVNYRARNRPEKFASIEFLLVMSVHQL